VPPTVAAIVNGRPTDGLATATLDQKCVIAKLKAAGKRTAAKLVSHQKAIAKGLAVDPACVLKADVGFVKASPKSSGLRRSKSDAGSHRVRDSRLATRSSATTGRGETLVANLTELDGNVFGIPIPSRGSITPRERSIISAPARSVQSTSTSVPRTLDSVSGRGFPPVGMAS
jgi:hypothetical protein